MSLLQVPPPGVQADVGGRGEGAIGDVEILVAVSTGAIPDEDPAQGDQPLTRLEPVPRGRERLHLAGAPAVPGHGQTTEASPGRERFLLVVSR